MPRPLRLDHEGAWHHVMNRGAGRRAIFNSDTDREHFLGCCISAAGQYGLELHAYCLLGNHYHLLVRSVDGRLSDAMRWLSSRYTQSLNYDKGQDGPMFRGRFASVLISEDEHLLEASRYIHLNPVSAGLATVPVQWPWSSAAAYLNVTPPPPWLVTDAILGMFDAKGSTQSYENFLAAGMERDALKPYEKRMPEHGVRPAGSDPG
jgi:putative transposase